MCFFGRNFTKTYVCVFVYIYIYIYIYMFPFFGGTFRQKNLNNVFEFFVHISTQIFVS
jgi:hypothetical protein